MAKKKKDEVNRMDRLVKEAFFDPWLKNGIFALITSFYLVSLLVLWPTNRILFYMVLIGVPLIAWTSGNDDK